MGQEKAQPAQSSPSLLPEVPEAPASTSMEYKLSRACLLLPPRRGVPGFCHPGWRTLCALPGPGIPPQVVGSQQRRSVSKTETGRQGQKRCQPSLGLEMELLLGHISHSGPPASQARPLSHTVHF